MSKVLSMISAMNQSVGDVYVQQHIQNELDALSSGWNNAAELKQADPTYIFAEVDEDNFSTIYNAKSGKGMIKFFNLNFGDSGTTGEITYHLRSENGKLVVDI